MGAEVHIRLQESVFQSDLGASGETSHARGRGERMNEEEKERNKAERKDLTG